MKKGREKKGEHEWFDELIINSSTESPKTDELMKNWAEGRATHGGPMVPDEKKTSESPD